MCDLDKWFLGGASTENGLTKENGHNIFFANFSRWAYECGNQFLELLYDLTLNIWKLRKRSCWKSRSANSSVGYKWVGVSKKPTAYWSFGFLGQPSFLWEQEILTFFLRTFFELQNLSIDTLMKKCNKYLFN